MEDTRGLETKGEREKKKGKGREGDRRREEEGIDNYTDSITGISRKEDCSELKFQASHSEDEI